MRRGNRFQWCRPASAGAFNWLWEEGCDASDDRADPRARPFFRLRARMAVGHLQCERTAMRAIAAGADSESLGFIKPGGVVIVIGGAGDGCCSAAGALGGNKRMCTSKFSRRRHWQGKAYNGAGRVEMPESIGLFRRKTYRIGAAEGRRRWLTQQGSRMLPLTECRRRRAS